MERDQERRINFTVTLVLQAVVAVGFVVFVVRREWESAFFSGVTVLLTLAPATLSRRYDLHIPPEFQLVTVTYIVLAEYLGTVRGFYERFWWWDIALHTSSGFLLGIVGFIAIFLLNRTERLPRGTRPAFLCWFAATFSISMGVAWEIYEFGLDELLPGMNAQNRETGVRDTMEDLIVNAVGALVIATMGWFYLRTGRNSFIIDAIRHFIEHNPRLFRRPGRSGVAPHHR